ncbi:MAG: LacI family transcriptional regulator [Propionibacteriaceae bacterium]|nr:LacI family transcriptional regulator [Propionibacteriaceae bacterium]
MNDGGRRTTIIEVARLAGVSHQTVSRFVRFAGEGVTPPVQERIQAAIDELDYRPNLAARAMRTSRTGRLAVLLPEGSAHSSVEVLEGVTTTAREGGYDVDVVRVGGEREARDRRVVELVESSLFEGLLSLTPLEATVLARQSHTHLTVFGIYDHAMRGIGPVADATPIQTIIEQLAADGHRRFLHIAGSYTHESACRRRDMYLATIENLGLESHGVVESDWRPEDAMQAILDLPAGSGVTAVIAANDRLAAAAIRGALTRGWQVPGDLSVTGFDCNPIGPWMVPSLTSVRINHRELGRRAMAQHIAELTGAEAAVDDTPIMTVEWHESAGPAPA